MRSRVLLAAFVVVVARAGAGNPVLSPNVMNALTTIDTLPTQVQLDTVFQGSANALSGLASIAADSTTDVGIRLRAVHALVHYCVAPCADTDAAHATLVQILQATSQEVSGANLLVLRAAIEAMGPMRVSADLDRLLPFLDHPSRDVRATTALALRDLCDVAAVNPLRVRLGSETVDQVRFAISEALRVLGQSPTCQ